MTRTTGVESNGKETDEEESQQNRERGSGGGDGHEEIQRV